MPLPNIEQSDTEFYLSTVSEELRKASTGTIVISMIESDASDDLFIQYNTSRELMRRDVMGMVESAVENARTACSSARTSLNKDRR